MRERNIGRLMEALAAAMVLMGTAGAGLAGRPETTTTIWVLDHGSVVSRGEKTVTPEGTTTTGFVVEASAVSTGRPRETASLTLVLSIFEPAADTAVQKRGAVYVSGVWSLGPAGVPVTSFRVAAQTPGSLRGQIVTELPGNPVTGWRGLSSPLRLPMSHSGTSWHRGEGFLELDAAFHGRIVLNISQITREER